MGLYYCRNRSGSFQWHFGLYPFSAYSPRNVHHISSVSRACAAQLGRGDVQPPSPKSSPHITFKELFLIRVHTQNWPSESKNPLFTFSTIVLQCDFCSSQVNILSYILKVVIAGHTSKQGGNSIQMTHYLS